MAHNAVADTTRLTLLPHPRNASQHGAPTTGMNALRQRWRGWIETQKPHLRDIIKQAPGECGEGSGRFDAHGGVKQP